MDTDINALIAELRRWARPNSTASETLVNRAADALAAQQAKIIEARQQADRYEHVDGLKVTRHNMAIVIRERDAAREALANAMRHPVDPIPDDEWEYGRSGDFGDGHQRVMLDSQAAALGGVSGGVPVRRRKSIPAGPWLPVEQEGER